MTMGSRRQWAGNGAGQGQWAGARECKQTRKRGTVGVGQVKGQQTKGGKVKCGACVCVVYRYKRQSKGNGM